MQSLNRIAPASLPGAVIDPETGRACALAADIAKGLNIAPTTVAKCNPRIYHGRYSDIEDVIAVRRLARGPGRPRIVPRES